MIKKQAFGFDVANNKRKKGNKKKSTTVDTDKKV
jgi:hypothetical protein